MALPIGLPLPPKSRLPMITEYYNDFTNSCFEEGCFEVIKAELAGVFDTDRRVRGGCARTLRDESVDRLILTL